MSRKGNYWDNAPVERFFRSLKWEWLTGVIYQTRQATISDVQAYIRYYT